MISQTEYQYKDYIITYEPKPIPTDKWDFNYAHKDFDGPEDGRYGIGSSIIDCMQQINLQISMGY